MIELSTRKGRWGRTPVFVLIVLSAVLSACMPGDREPVSEPIEGYELPERRIESGADLIVNRGARERLLVQNRLPERPVRLLFMAGRAASPSPDGGSVWADLEGGRIILFDRRGGISRIVQPGEGDTPLQPVVARSRGDELHIFERDGSLYSHRLGESVTPAPHGLPVPVTGAGLRYLAASRSPLHLPLAPVRTDAPLVWLSEEPSNLPRPLGRVTLPGEPMLGYLHNTGWAVPTPDGAAYFASAIRPELVRIEPDGSLGWKSTWDPPTPVPTPRITAVDGTARADFRIIQHAVALGDDGRIYLLVSPGSARQPDVILAFDPDGTLARTATIPPGYAVFINPKGALTALPEAMTLSNPVQQHRSAFAEFRLPGLTRHETVALNDYTDRVVIVNFWASWCPPCRREIPFLDSLAQELGPRGVAVVGLNDDRLPRQGAAFLTELGGVSYANGAGEGGLRRSYRYTGLPYTVVLDREHRIVRSFYGFGGSLETLRRVVLEELERIESTPAPVREPTLDQ